MGRSGPRITCLLPPSRWLACRTSITTTMDLVTRLYRKRPSIMCTGAAKTAQNAVHAHAGTVPGHQAQEWARCLTARNAPPTYPATRGWSGGLIRIEFGDCSGRSWLLLCLRVCGGRGRLLLMLRRAIDLLVCGFHGRHEPVADGTALSWAPCHAHAMAFSWALRATGCSGRVVEHMPLSNCVGGWGLKRRLRSGRGGLKSCNVVLGPNHKRPKGHTPRSSGGARHAVPLKLKLIKSCTTRGGPA